MFKTSIRTTLVAPTLLAIILTGIVVAVFAFQNATYSVNSVASKLRQEKLDRVLDHLATFFSAPQDVLTENARVLAEGLLEPRNPEIIKRHFLRQNIEFGSFNSIYFGNPAGGLVGGGVEPDGVSYYTTSTQDFRAGPFSKVKTDAHAKPEKPLLTLPDFDARTRPWYKAALAAEGGTWSDIYILFTGHDMAITPSHAVRTEDGQVLGVVGGDIFLSGINRFLERLHKEQQGHTFIFEKSGDLVASSADERPFNVSADGKRKTRVRITDSTVPVIAASSAAILDTVGDLRTVTAPRSLDFNMKNQRYFVEIAPFQDRYGLSLLVATVLPEAAYADSLEKHTSDTIILIVLTLVIMAAIAFSMARRITRPIVELTNSIDEMSKGNLSTELALDRDDELGRLAKSFNRMARELEAAFKARDDRETQLQNQGRFLDSIIENIPNMLFVKDAEELKFVRFNRAGERLLGISREEMIGKNDRDFFAREQAEFFIAKDREVLGKQGEMDIAHEPIDTRNLGKRILHTKKIGVYDDAGNPMYLLGISEDVTEKLRAEEELRMAKREAERANQAKSEFLAAMSHDLRTPLNAIMGFSDMMRERAFGHLGDPHYEEYAEDIHSSGALLESLINDVLDLSKIEAGKYELDFQSVKIEQTINLSIRQISSLARTSNTSIVSEFPDALPEIVTDERVLTQVLNNLLSNAVKFTPAGGAITVSAALTTERRVTVSVSDNGIGMSQTDVEKAIRPFEQANPNTARRHKGTGLGLYLCAKFIQLLQGTFTIESALDEGTTVTFDLPIDPPPAPTDHPTNDPMR